MQSFLDRLFKEDLKTEMLGFMSTFLYTNKYFYDRKANRCTSTISTVIESFWNLYYTNDLNVTVRKIFISSLIKTWNKSPLPKVKNSIECLVKLGNGEWVDNIGKKHGFPYSNQSVFYQDVVQYSSDIKKSVKKILFSKVMTTEGGFGI
jgi:hypothetical protein